MLQRYVREVFNGLTHFAGMLLAVAGVVWLWIDVRSPEVDYAFWPLAIFGGSMVLLFLSSTLYHSLHVPDRWTQRLRRFDHMMIYVFIAGTYTPLCMFVLGGTLGWRLFAAVWTLAAMGVAFKLFWIGAPRWLSVATYLGMGWLAIFLISPIAAQMSAGQVAWSVTGGVVYSLGALVYATKWPNFHPHFGFHELWHVFVMAGCFSHFWAIRSFVLV